MQRNVSNENGVEKTKLITALEVQKEYLNIDIRRVRAFLNLNCKYRRIGRQYFYIRKEVEDKLINLDQNVEYCLEKSVRVPRKERGR